MPVFVAMLRGVNVGKNPIKMEHLRVVFEQLGFSNIKTYIQSGNVVFSASRSSLPDLIKAIESKLRAQFGVPVRAILKTAAEMKEIVRANPFVKDRKIDQSKLHVTFLSHAPQNEAIPNLKALAAKSEFFQVLNREVYLYCPDGYGKSKLSNAAIERKLSVVATTRNWRTVNALNQLVE